MIFFTQAPTCVTVATLSSQVMTRSRWKKIVTSFYRSLLFFWHHSENWVFLKTVSFHFQSIKWAFTLQWCKTWLGRSLTRAVSEQSFKIPCSNGNGFWLVYEDLLIDFGRTKFPPKSRYDVLTFFLILYCLTKIWQLINSNCLA